MPPVTIATFLGSLRSGSFNAQLLREAQRLAPEGVVLEVLDVSGFPHFDDDVRAEGIPQSVVDVGERVLAADAVLFVSPEYNYSIPGTLKNGIDWISRLSPQPFAGKAVGMMGVSTGRLGTARMQYHLRQVLVFLDAHPVNKPEVMVPFGPTAFDDDGRLIDEVTAGLVAQHLATLLAHAQRLAA
jgi:chromate reductase